MMGTQIIKQPNGKYLLWSSNEDRVVLYNGTPEEIVEFWLVETKAHFKDRVSLILKKLEEGEKPYCQFTLTFEEVLDKIEHLSGPEDKILNSLKCQRKILQ